MTKICLGGYFDIDLHLHSIRLWLISHVKESNLVVIMLINRYFTVYKKVQRSKAFGLTKFYFLSCITLSLLKNAMQNPEFTPD